MYLLNIYIVNNFVNNSVNNFVNNSVNNSVKKFVNIKKGYIFDPY